VPAWEAVQGLVSLLKTLPSTLVAQDHVGLRRPGATADLPRIVVSAAGIQDVQAGIGGVIGSRQVSSTSWASDVGSMSSGTFTVELWAGDEASLTTLATGVFSTLEDPLAAVGAGFSRLAAESVGPMSLTTLDGLQPGGATGLRLAVGCVFSFEAVTPVQTGPDGIIKQIEVDVHEFDTSSVNEVLNIP
jgi:hypothetical protein